jgi:Signal transduction histidine kinase
MKKRGMGIFGKIFLYTLLFLLIVIGVALAFFAGQFQTVFQSGQNQVHKETYTPLIEQLQGKPRGHVAEIAESFHEQNLSLAFYIQAGSSETLYQTPSLGATPNDKEMMGQSKLVEGDMHPVSFAVIPISEDIALFVATTPAGNAVFVEFIEKSITALALLLVISVTGAAILARGMTKPIKHLAADTTQMANLEFVSSPSDRRDEIGQLSSDVFAMYERLKNTIVELENEIKREQEMEENQRYFFSAASHELKTPIASTLVLLQGMLDDMGEYKDHPKYLRECIKKMQTQSKTISEILEVVRLSDSKVKPKWEKVNLKDTLEPVLSSCLPLVEAKGQNIAGEIPDLIFCRTDKNMLARVLSNVVLNAVQNTPEHGEIRIWGEVCDEESVRLCVFNNGTSLDEDILPKLLEPFYRPDKARSSSQGRSGLGLTIVKKTLDCLMIPFSLTNTGEGVLFHMDLPRCSG